MCIRDRAEGTFDTFVADLSQTFAGFPVHITYEFPQGSVYRLDWDRLRQVITNLINNSIQAIEPLGRSGTVKVTVTDRHSSLVITVVDDGPGIPPEIQDRIFDPFFTTRRDGNGLGLVICRKIVRLMGGSFELSSSQPGETIFSISLPKTTP